DADVVLLVASSDQAQYEQVWAELEPWVISRTERGLSVVAVPIFEIAEDLGKSPSAQELREELADRFNDRALEADAPRFLGLIGRRDAAAGASIPAVPGFKPSVAGTTVPTD